MRHLLALHDLSAAEIERLLARAAELKSMRARGEPGVALRGKTLALMFEKASTRTRVSFAVGMAELGGSSVYLEPSRDEPPQDTARVLSRYCHGIVVRTYAQETAQRFARSATVPVINGLTDLHHPCQVLADLLTVRERRGRLAGLGYAWIGDGSNVANSWVEAAGLLGLRLRVACPEGFSPHRTVLERAGPSVELLRRPADAVQGADVVITDTWTSMGQEAERAARLRAFAGYTVDAALLGHAAPDAMVMHCLPAHRGEEITDEVIEGPASVVFDEAENRLHVQKALLETLLGGQ